MDELSGSWTFRSFNPTYVRSGNEPVPGRSRFEGQIKERDLIYAPNILAGGPGTRPNPWANPLDVLFKAGGDGLVLNLDERTLSRSGQPAELRGALEWPEFGGPHGIPAGGLDLNGTVRLYSAFRSLDFVATGRPNTATEDWEFRYHGHLTGPWFPVPDWVKIPINQHPTLVGSVIKLGAAWGNVGEVFSFIAVKQPGQPDGVSGLWNYRTVNNNPELIYRGNWHNAPFETPPQPAPEIISQEAEFTLGTSQKEGITTLQGSASGTGWLQTGWGTFTLKLNGRVFEQGGDEPPNFILEGSSFQSLGEDGGEFGYRGQLTRHWEKGVGQRPALVGDVIRYGKKSTWNHPNTWPEYRSDLQPPLPDGYVTPFIAVKR